MYMYASKGPLFVLCSPNTFRNTKSHPTLLGAKCSVQNVTVLRKCVLWNCMKLNSGLGPHVLQMLIAIGSKDALGGRNPAPVEVGS